MNNTYSAISLFAGCGGKDLGFYRAGFNISWANDCDAAACVTYRANLGPHIVLGDIRSIPSKSIPPADVVIGGFPCQGFSIVGTRRLDDERNFLYREMKRVIRDIKPAFFVAENVRGLLNMEGGKVIAAMLAEFRSLGYKVDYRLLNACQFGAPQNRERVFIIGNRLGLQNPFPEPTHVHSAAHWSQPGLFPSNKVPCSRYKTMRDAIGDLELLGGLPNHEVDKKWAQKHPEWLAIMRHIKEGQKLCNVRLGPRSVYTWDIPDVFGPVTRAERKMLMSIAANRRHKQYGKNDGNPLPGKIICEISKVENPQNVLRSLVKKEYLVKAGAGFELKNAFNGIFRRLRWDKPSEAVLTVFDSPRYYMHPSQHRPFSVREAARIQGFPDEFIFYGTLKEQYTQVGNAVPPTLAEAVAREIWTTLAAWNNTRCADSEAAITVGAPQS
ncbi:DNA cytosine methyltransferase [Patescibacteria group bacterium]|nr:DNA cytosine methyltransferase [Patescibacteria group bacterium]